MDKKQWQRLLKKNSLNEVSTTSFGKDMRSVFYELGDKIYNLVDLGKNTKDYTISQHAVKIRSLFESLKKYLDKTYDWD